MKGALHRQPADKRHPKELDLFKMAMRWRIRLESPCTDFMTLQDERRNDNAIPIPNVFQLVALSAPGSLIKKG